MTGEKLFEYIGDIDDRYIDEAVGEESGQAEAESSVGKAENTREKADGDPKAINININEKRSAEAGWTGSGTDKKARTARLANMAACFICLICAAGIGAFSLIGNGGNGINENGYSFMKNGSYDYLFADSGNELIYNGADRDGGDGIDGSWYKTADSIAECPYEYSRSFDEKRAELEAENKILVLEDNRKFSCTAAYMKDGSIYNVAMNWWHDGVSVELTAAYNENAIKDLSCCVAEMVDKDGNVVKPKETVVDGITIKSEGSIRGYRALSFNKDGIWYRLSSADDSNDDLGKVLDWVWNNGVDLKNAFVAENGDKIEYESFIAEGVEDYGDMRAVKSSEFYNEIPVDFTACLPKFDELGWKPVKCDITLKNGEPDEVECTYDYGGDRRTIWTVNRIDSRADEQDADMYVEQGSEYDLGELSELLFYGAVRNGQKTEGYKRLEKAVNGEQGLIIGFSVRKNDEYRFAEDRGEADREESVKPPEGIEVLEGNPDYRPDYYYTAFTTGRLTTEQVWQALGTVYSNWR